MKNKSFWISIIAVIISFAGGFILANAFNRIELDALRAENARLKSEPEKSVENIFEEIYLWIQQNQQQLKPIIG